MPVSPPVSPAHLLGAFATPPELVLFGLALCVFLTAALWAASAWLRSAPPAAAPPDWALGIFVAVVGTVVAVGWWALVLAVLGRYSLVGVGIGLLAMGTGLGLGVARSHRYRPRRQLFARSGWQELALALLLLVGAGLYFRPHEYVLGGADAGTYINTALATAATGAYLQVDPWTTVLAEHRAVTLREQPAPMLSRYLQFVGWYLQLPAAENAQAVMVPQFFPFHPLLLAVGASLGGIWGALNTTPLWGVLDIAALYFLARKLLGRHVALVASLLLTVTTTQIFFARYPTTEPLTLLLLFAALLAYQTLWEDEQAGAGWGVFGGAAVGSALLTRVDLPLILLLMVSGMGVRAWQRRWSAGWSAYAITLGLFCVQLAFTARFLSWPYFWNSYYAAYRLALVTGLLWIGPALLLATLAVAARVGPQRATQFVGAFLANQTVRWTLAGAVVALSAYAYFLRPILEPVRYATSWPGDVRFPILNGQNWLRMGWYLTPFGLLLSTVGLAWILVRQPLTRMAVVLSIGVLTSVQYIFNVLNTPYHIYVMRRYVPVVIPFLLLFAAQGTLAFPWLQRRWVTVLVRGGAVALLAGGILYQARVVLPLRDYAGAVTQLAALEQQLKPKSLLLIIEPEASIFGDAFGPPMRFLFGHDVATIRASGDDLAPFLADAQEWATARDIPMQMIAIEPVAPAVRAQLTLAPAAFFPFTTQMLMNTFDSFPSILQTVHYGIEIYDVLGVGGRRTQPATAPGATEDAGLVDIGALDSIYIDDGFFGKEYIPGAATMRWTGAASAVELPAVAVQQAAKSGDTQVQVQAMIYRPEGVPPYPVTVTLDGMRIGEFIPTGEWQTYTFPVTATSLFGDGQATVRFATQTFNPAELGVNEDQRDLGFLLDWLRLEPGP